MYLNKPNPTQPSLTSKTETKAIALARSEANKTREAVAEESCKQLIKREKQAERIKRSE